MFRVTAKQVDLMAICFNMLALPSSFGSAYAMTRFGLRKTILIGYAFL